MKGLGNLIYMLVYIYIHICTGITIKYHVAPSQSFAEVEVIKEDGPAAIEGTLRVG